jgi:hypothetical protein
VAKVRVPPNSDGVRGRNDHYWPSPAQIRASGIPARAPCLGCLTANRTLGQDVGYGALGESGQPASPYVPRPHAATPAQLPVPEHSESETHAMPRCWSARHDRQSSGRTLARAERTAWGRCGSLILHRNGLAPSTPCRSDRRTISQELSTTRSSIQTATRVATTMTARGTTCLHVKAEAGDLDLTFGFRCIRHLSGTRRFSERTISSCLSCAGWDGFGARRRTRFLARLLSRGTARLPLFKSETYGRQVQAKRLLMALEVIHRPATIW